MADRVWVEVERELAKHVFVSDVDWVKIGIGRQVLRPTIAQIVDDQNLVPRLDGRLGDMAPDEACASSH
jgi:hypothetical protein